MPQQLYSPQPRQHALLSVLLLQAEYSAAVRESYQLLQGAITAINDALEEVGWCSGCSPVLQPGGCSGAY